MPTCSECKGIVPTVKALVHHLQIIHKVTSASKFACGEEGCVGKFDSPKNLKSHLRKVHGFLDFVRPDKTPDGNLPHISNEEQDAHCNDNGDPSSDAEMLEDNIINNISVADFKAALYAQSDAFVGKLYSKPGLPRSQVQEDINDTDVFLGGGFLNLLKEKCLVSLDACNADFSVVKDIRDMFEVLENPFRELKTEHLRLKRYCQSGNYIPSTSYFLGKELVTVATKDGHKCKWVDVNAQFFPLRYILKRFLELPSSLNNIMSYLEYLESEMDTISNFVQGQLWKSKCEKYRSDDTVLPLLLYFDDFETNNPLGPHSEKIGGVYASIPCLPPECRASLENIFLALLFRSVDRQEFGNQKILKPLINELKYLEENGIIVETPDNGEKRIYFVLGLIIGDNLGIHQLCGFIESFSANYPCRFCKESKAETETQDTLQDTLLRNIDNYDTDVALGNPSRSGINVECEFNSISSFHITSNFAVDGMHDVAEGIVLYVMHFIVKKFISLKYFSLYDLNNRIRMFNFGPHVSNKPPCISDQSLEKDKLKMTASEALCFVRHFGILIGDLIPTSEPCWRLYLAFMRVFDVVQAKTIPRTESQSFPVLVQEFLCLWKKQGKILKPKFHFLLHYATVMKMCGPVSHLSCMRFEAKHRQLKRSSGTNMSRVNLPHSLGVKHQLAFCYRLMASQRILPNVITGPCEEIELLTHANYDDFLASLPDKFKNSGITFVPKWITFKGTNYTRSMVLITGRDNSLLWPLFGKIQLIILDENSVPLFVCRSLRNIGFSDHFYAYEVVPSKDWFCISHIVISLTLYLFMTIRLPVVNTTLC